MRTAEEILMRCTPILGRQDIVLLVSRSSSPTATYEMVMNATGSSGLAKAARWLSVLRRDYPDKYAEATQNILCQAQKSTAQKGVSHEDDIRSGLAERQSVQQTS
jgi:hypothetical protein